jgi:hypothetical protein
MRIIFALRVLGLAVSASAPASAEVYPWCAHYAGRIGGTNCGFVSFDQCQAALSGNGGYCGNNPFYTAAAAAPTHRRRHHHY